MLKSCTKLVAAIVALSFVSQVHAQVHVSTLQWHKKAAEKYGALIKRPVIDPGTHRAIGAVEEVGDAPNGFGKTVFWDPREKEATFVIFINTADPLGVAIADLKKGDVVEVTSVDGIGSFGRGKGKLVSSMVTVAALAVTALVPEAAPFLKVGEDFADKQFGQPSNSERRDGYGQDPGNGDWCQDEGGLLICLPSAGGVYYQSGGGTKKKEPRYDRNRPDHVKNGFFPVRGDKIHNTRKLDQDGELYVIAWDSEFADNLGYYKMFLKVTRP